MKPTAEAFAPDQPAAEYRDVVETLTPDEAVAPVVVSVVLVRLPGALWLSSVVTSGAHPLERDGGRQDGVTGIQMQRHATLQAYRVGGVGSRRKVHHSTATGRALLDRPVDGVAVDRLSFALRSQLSHIDPGLRSSARIPQLVGIHCRERHALVH